MTPSPSDHQKQILRDSMIITMKILDVAHTRGLLYKEAFDKAKGAVYICKRLVELGTIQPDEIKLRSHRNTEE